MIAQRRDLALMSAAAILCVVLNTTGGVVHADEGRDPGPFFRIETLRSGGRVWADPRLGVWFSNSRGFTSPKPATLLQRRASIETAWPDGGHIHANYTPILGDPQGRIWFYDRSGFSTRRAPYARFDGTEWIQPPLPESSRRAPPYVEYRSTRSDRRAGIVDRAGTPVFFDGLGVLIWKDNAWIHGSFLEFGTDAEKKEAEQRGWRSPFGTEFGSATTARGELWLWGKADTNRGAHSPPGVTRILFWNGETLVSHKGFRGIPAVQIREICSLPNGDAWVLASIEPHSRQAWPIFVRKGATTSINSLADVRPEHDEFSLPTWRSVSLVFHDRQHVYVAIAGRIFRLLGDGGWREKKEDPWSSLGPAAGSLRRQRVDPDSLWILAHTKPQDRLFFWDGKDLTAHDLRLGGSVKGIGGLGPDGRLYLGAGHPAPFVVSVDPRGYPNPPVTAVTNMHQPGTRLRLDAQGHMCVHEALEHCKLNYGNSKRPLPALWPPTQRFEEDGWKVLWEPTPPQRPPWRSRGGPPPLNALERADSREYLVEHFDEIRDLLQLPEAPFYRHKMVPLGRGRIFWIDEGGAAIYDGKTWFDFAESLQIPRKLLTYCNLMFVVGTRQLWYEGKENWVCFDLPEDADEPVRVQHVIKPLPQTPWLGMEHEDTVWELNERGPRRICKIAPARLQVATPDRRLCAVDSVGRTYIVGGDEGMLEISDGAATWSGSHEALVARYNGARFAFDARGRIWCCSSMGLLVWDAPRDGGGELQLLHFEPRDTLFLYDYPCFDTFGNLWLAPGPEGQRVILGAGTMEFTKNPGDREHGPP